MHDDNKDHQPRRDYSLDDAIASNYARQQEGLPPPNSHLGYASFGEAFVAQPQVAQSGAGGWSPAGADARVLPDPSPEQ